MSTGRTSRLHAWELEAARELAAALAESPMLAVGVALMPRRQFTATLRRAKKLLTEQLMRDGMISAAEAEKTL